MMSIVLALLAVGIVWLLRSVWPVSGLTFVDTRILEETQEEMTTLKIIDPGCGRLLQESLSRCDQYIVRPVTVRLEKGAVARRACPDPRR